MAGNIQVTNIQRSGGYYSDSGSANAYAVTLSPAITAYTTGLTFSFMAANTNTGASTIAVNGLAAKNFRKSVSVALSAGDIVAGQVYEVVYDGTNFLIYPGGDVAIGFVFDGGGSVLTTGLKGGIEIPFACRINGWTITSIDNTTGSIVVDVWKDTYANFPPTVADTITGSEKPTISSSTKGQDLSLTTWTLTVAAGDWLFFNIDSVSSLKLVSLSIRAVKI